MSMKLNAGDTKHVEGFGIYPHEIIVDAKTNSRSVPHTLDEVKALAKSILDDGQLQLAVVRRHEDSNKVQLVAGFGRHAAVTYINTVLQPDNPIRLQCKVLKCSAEEAFVKSIKENEDRKEVNAIDRAYAQQYLMEQFQWSAAKVAELYKCTVAAVYTLSKATTLSKPIQEEVKNGTLPISTAITLTKLPEEKREEVLQEAKKEDGTVNAGVINNRVREHQQETGTGHTSRAIKEIRAFFDDMTGPAESPAIRGLATALVRYINGELTDKQMEEAVVKYTKNYEEVCVNA